MQIYIHPAVGGQKTNILSDSDENGYYNFYEKIKSIPKEKKIQAGKIPIKKIVRGAI